MTDDPKSAFEFDPLPGDTAKPPEPTPPVKRGRPAKPERKNKRGHRPRGRVVIPPGSNAMAETQAGTKAAVDVALGRGRKKRNSKIAPTSEIVFIRQMMALTESARKKVLAALNEIFG